MIMWKYVAYVKRGLSHEGENLDCQDSIQIHEDDRCIVAALADGLGSLKYSALASQAATVAACQWLAAAGVEKLMLETPKQEQHFRAAFTEAVSAAVRKMADQNSVKHKSLDCTLAFVYISKVRDHALVGLIGDSAVCVITEDASFSFTDSGSFAGGTRAVQDPDAGEHMLLKKCTIRERKILGFILTSDGLDNEIYIKGSNHVNQGAGEYFNALLDPNPTAVIENAIADLTSYENTPFDDDISIAVISRAQKPVTLDVDPTWLCTCGYRNVLQNTYCVNCNQDFTRLYSNVRFREHGGKAAFFKKLNKNPDEERMRIGLPPVAADGENITRTAPALTSPTADATAELNSKAGSDKAAKKSDRPEKRVNKAMFQKPVVAAAAAALAVGAIMGMVIGRFSSHGRIDTLLADVEALRNEVAEKDAQLAEVQKPLHNETPMLLLPDGSIYWGEYEEQLPEGKGIMLADGVYYIGTFTDGLRNGEFLVVSDADMAAAETVEYVMDEIKVSDNITYRIISDTSLYNMPGSDQTEIISTVSKGDKVNGTGTVTTVGETEWAEVYWDNGLTLWFALSNAEVAEQDAEQTVIPGQTEPTEEQTQEQMIYEVTVNQLNVRNKPGEKGTKIIGKVYLGDLLTGTGKEEAIGSSIWVEIVWEDGTAWVSSKRLEKQS